MSLSNAVTKVMTHRLSEMGYPSHDLRWSLGYCQGDGASFTGKLDLKVLGARILPDVNPAIWDNADLDVELTRSGRYVHERSTSLNYDVQSIHGSTAQELGGPAQKVALERLLAVVCDEVVDVGADMAADGYKVIESYIREKQLIRTFKTQHFAVQVWEVPDEDSSPFDWCDVDYAKEQMRKLLAEEIYFGGVRVVVNQIDEDGDVIAELATAESGGTDWLRTESVFKTGVVRELVDEAVKGARATFAKLNRPKLKLAA